MTAPALRRAVPAQGTAPAAEALARALESYRLAELAQAGDPDAFAAIYRRYHPKVFRFVLFKIGNAQTAEDLTQDTFVRAFRRIDRYQWQGKDIGAWLVTIARNLVADHFKSGRFRTELLTAEVTDPAAVDRSPEANPEQTVADYFANTVLAQMLLELSPEQREVLVLRFYRGLSTSETAQVMGKLEGAIKAMQYRAVRSLRRLLPADWDGAR